ncbi:type 1 glutamine amidotransferase domain-containing protein [Streptomyces sp. CBMA156]|uniref:type 1 glutamine amidotransferase domain-containing protein n=1 Tax=Streptomyces sp. CBMA156 TaxID=1930280 RepID=UPI001661BB66|nr:type 1 glutamine amidotransferase domain-containing protein [Streptomyces sp. CBMA156]MBD0673259.1 type 1 glutamine amidotransferase domain-containing protein [Streptomyces sp. CBMA156]MBD0676493.1 type 1 glutamine amidotransferase domain-containing protein [Streptomyces sp. CBMA156]
MADILFVLTGSRSWTLNDGTAHPTGFWAEEAVVPYRAFTEAGHRVTAATPGGVVPVADRASLTDPAMAEEVEKIAEFRQPLVLAEVDPADYDVVYYPGGHGPMEDLAVDADSGRLLTRALASGRPLGVVCHGPAALLAARTADGGSPFTGYRVTGFTNAEETQAGLADRAPWLLQDRLAGIGVDFEEGEPWAPHVEVDRNLVTGQNPASSALVATELLKLLDASAA